MAARPAPVRRLNNRQPRLPVISLSRGVLKWLTAALLLLDVVSATVLQRGIMHLESYTPDTLYQALKPEGGMFGWATLTILCSLLAVVAVPIFSKLLVEGWQHTHSLKGYLLSLAVLALVTEPCYDFATQGSFFDMSSQNPVWALLFALIMLEILRRYKTTGGLDVAIKVLVILAALVWTVMLRVRWGPAIVPLCVLFYLAANSKPLTYILGIALSVIYFPAPLGLLFVHWYNGEVGKAPLPKWLFYALYPALLLLGGAAVLLLRR